MYLVRHMRGMASAPGLKQFFHLFSNTLGIQNKILLKTSWTKIGDIVTIGLVGYRLKSQTDTRTRGKRNKRIR